MGKAYAKISMKILFILDLYKPHIGGAEILFENIINRLAQEWHEITILSSRFNKSLPKEEILNDKIRIYRAWSNRYNFMLYSLKIGSKLAKNVDVIHTTTYNSAIPAKIIAQIAKKPIVITVHEIFWELWYQFLWWKGFFYKSFESLIFKFSFDKYICVSNYTKNSLRIHFWIKDRKLITIYNGIDYNFWNEKNFSKAEQVEIRSDLWIDDNYVGLFYGRAGISKWLEFYLRAIPKIVENIPTFKALLIVSNSSNNPTNHIVQLIKELRIEKNIIMLPGVSHTALPKYILASDFAIIPSLAEWFGFAVAEVSALWKNLITTEVAAIPEVASGKVNFIEAGNVESIASEVINLSKGKYSKITKKQFEWTENIDKTINVYNKILWK